MSAENLPDAVANDEKLVPLPVPFPAQCIGASVIIEVIEEARSQKIALPKGQQRAARHITVGRVISAGPGEYSVMGQLIPTGVELGDMVVCQAEALHRIDYGVRGHLVDRGVDADACDRIAILQTMHVLCKLPKLD